jgi:hypothetical protein
VSRIELGGALCDMPSAWGPSAPITVLEEGMPIDYAPAALSAARDSTTIWLALAHAGAIAIARASTATPDDFEILDTLAPEGPNEVAGLVAPALVRGIGATDLYSVGEGSTGTRALLLARATDGTPTFTRVPGARATLPLARALAVAARPDELRLLIARGGASDRPGDTELTAFVASGDAAVLLTAVSLPLGPLGASFVGDTSLSNRGGAWQLFLGVKRGTRTGVALFTSHEGIHWRATADDPVLEGRAGTPDALGVRSPAAVGGASTDEAWLYYVGTDGAQERLMRVTRRGTERGSFL